jgi:hypothetical protein
MQPRSLLKLIVLLQFSLSSLPADQVQFQQVKREFLERRLEQATRDNRDRLRLLTEMFTDSGCTVEQQSVRGSKFPNLICTLAGSGGSAIVVGAH